MINLGPSRAPSRSVSFLRGDFRSSDYRWGGKKKTAPAGSTPTGAGRVCSAYFTASRGTRSCRRSPCIVEARTALMPRSIAQCGRGCRE